jgi:hypothetical protein
MNDPADERFVVAGVIGIIAVLILIVSLLRIYAAIMNFSFKRRALGITSLILGLGTCLTFYCALTSIALAVYGLIVMMNQEVAEAFKMRAEGRSSDDILREFNNRPA